MRHPSKDHPLWLRQSTRPGRAKRWRVWLAVSRATGPTTLKEIAAAAGLPRMTTRFHVNALIDLGYVARRPGLSQTIVPLVRAFEVPR